MALKPTSKAMIKRAHAEGCPTVGMTLLRLKKACSIPAAQAPPHTHTHNIRLRHHKHYHLQNVRMFQHNKRHHLQTRRMFHHQKRHHLQHPRKFHHQKRHQFHDQVHLQKHHKFQQQKKTPRKIDKKRAPPPAPNSTSVRAKPSLVHWWSISSTTEPTPPPAPSAEPPSAAPATHLFRTELQDALRAWQFYSEAGRGRHFWTQPFVGSDIYKS